MVVPGYVCCVAYNAMLCFSLFLQFVMLICEYIAVGKGVSDGTILDRKKRSKYLS